MKNRCRNIFKVVGVFLLGFLGFPSCTKEEPDPLESQYVDPGAMRTAYGVPTAKYKVSGKVFSGSGKPIAGIKVDVSFTPGWSSTSIYTSSDGSFSSEIIHSQRDKVTLTFTDIDGIKNQGDFQTQSVTIEAKQTEKGDGYWFMGTYSVSTTVKLNKK